MVCTANLQQFSLQKRQRTGKIRSVIELPPNIVMYTKLPAKGDVNVLFMMEVQLAIKIVWRQSSKVFLRLRCQLTVE